MASDEKKRQNRIAVGGGLREHAEKLRDHPHPSARTDGEATIAAIDRLTDLELGALATFVVAQYVTETPTQLFRLARDTLLRHRAEFPNTRERFP